LMLLLTIGSPRKGGACPGLMLVILRGWSIAAAIVVDVHCNFTFSSFFALFFLLLLSCDDEAYTSSTPTVFEATAAP